MQKVAMIDMDETIVDWASVMIPALKDLESSEESGKYDYSDTWKVEKTYPFINKRLKYIMSKQGFWTSLKPIESGLELYRKILKTEKFVVYLLSKCRKECSLAWKEKIDWIHKYLGYDANIYLVTDKKYIYGDLLIDDVIENAEDFLSRNPKARVIMPSRTYNNCYLNERVYRWNDSPIKKTISNAGVVTNVYDFRGPLQVIKQVLNG